jgi:hypothetical protein
MSVTDERALTIDELLQKSYAAQRDIPKVGDEEHPTPWDLDHRRIDELLDRLES